MSPASADRVASNRAKIVLGIVGAAIVVALIVVAVNAALPTDSRPPQPLSANERLERVYDELGYDWNCSERSETPGKFNCWQEIPGNESQLRQCDATVTADGDVRKVFCGTGDYPESGGGGWP